MARKVQVILSDDLDENLSADETVSFALDGTSYEIDLAEKNAKEMRDALSRYVSAARKVGRGNRASGGGRSRATGGRMDREQAGAIRDWVRQNGQRRTRPRPPPGERRGRLRGRPLKARPEARPEPARAEVLCPFHPWSGV